MVGYRMAKAFGSILIIVFIHMAHMSTRSFTVVVLVLISIWLVIISVMRTEYIQMLRKFLKGTLSGDAQPDGASSKQAFLQHFICTSIALDEKRAILGMQLYRLAEDANFHGLLAEEIHKPSNDLRAELTKFIAVKKDQTLNQEIVEFMRNRNLEDSVVALRFLNDIGQGADGLREHLERGDRYSRIAAACMAILDGLDMHEVPALREALEVQEETIEERILVNLTRETEGAEAIDEHKARVAVLALKRFADNNSGREQILDEIRQSLSSEKGDYASVLRALVADTDMPTSWKQELPWLMICFPDTDPTPSLYAVIQGQEGALRNAAIQALVEMRGRIAENKFDEELIFGEIEREVKSALRIQRVARVYRLLCDAKITGDEDFMQAQRSRFHECIEAIFHFLSLLAEPDDIRTIHDAIRHSSEHVKANAIELLENILVEQRLKKLVLQMLETEGTFGAETTEEEEEEGPLDLEAEATQLLQKDNRWCVLSMSSLALAFKVEKLYPKLRMMASSKDSFSQQLGAFVVSRLEPQILNPPHRA